MVSSSRSYHQITSHPGSTKIDEEPSAVGPVEMVTVPALGPEWKASELLDMTKRGKKEKKMEERQRKWKQFNRGQLGLCGQAWLTRRVAVFIAFGVCAAYVPSVNANASSSRAPSIIL